MTSQMSNVRTVAVIVLLLLVGPAMFIVSRGLSLARSFDKVAVGDPVATVLSTMGPPQQEAHSALYLQGDMEYRYSVWPLRDQWVIGLKEGKVVEKRKISAP